MPQAVNTDNLTMLRDVIGDDLKEILQSFIDIAPNALNSINHAIATQNAAELKLHAHTLKGSSANIGALELPSLALALENAGKTGNLVGCEAQFELVKQETQNVLDFLNEYLSSF